ncbi:hypothetical protein DYB25_013786, partial [Aphanomyces astaci]
SFKAIRSANTTLDLLIVAGELTKNGIPVFMDIKSAPDYNDSTKHALFGFRTPLPLDRPYYFNYFKWKAVEAEYKLYIASVLQLAGYTAEKAAAAVPVIVRFEQTLEGNTTLENLRTIVEYKLIHASSKHLTPEFRTANWNFFGKKIKGEDVEPTREKYCLSETEKTLGELLGQYFIDEVFPADAAKTADDLVKALKSSFSTGIATADWLDNSTRANAQTKLSKFVHLLGGPEKPQLYPTLTLDSKSYLNNRWKVSQVNMDTNLKLNGQPVNKHKFIPAPHDFDAAQNFGAIGMVIGHEITHGFDHIGRNYDGDGNLNPWWSNATNIAFKAKAQCISDQYSNFQVRSEVNGTVLGNINGNISLGETIADNGGLKTSFRAYHEYLKEFPSKYTEEAGNKLFYLSYAQSACSKNTDAYLARSLSWKHPRGRYRVTGALQNNAEFSRVFQCPTNSTLNPSKKCLLWE